MICPRLIEELARAFAYPKVRRYIAGSEADRLLEAIARSAISGGDPDDVPRIPQDPEDDYLFAVAAAHAQVLVSGARDITEVERPPVRVFTPRGFDSILRSREGP